MRSASIDEVRAAAPLKAALARFLDALSEHAENVEKTVLFGSVARGESGPQSDVDLLVIWKGSMSEARNTLARIATDILVETDVYVSAHPVSIPEYERIASMHTAFFEAVDKEGLVVA